MKNNEEKYPLDDMANAWLDYMLNGQLIKVGDRIGLEEFTGNIPNGTLKMLGIIDEDGPIKTEKEWIEYYKSDVMNGTDEENEELYQEYLISI